MPCFSKMDNHDIEWAYFSTQEPQFIARRPSGTEAQRRGRRYEKKVLAWLKHAYKHRLVPSPWLYYKAGCSLKWCQPDALLVWPELGFIYILEIKYSHTRRAWGQLQELYYPVLRKVFPADLWQLRTYEICRYYDPHTNFPGPLRLVDCIHPKQHPTLSAGTVGVHIWNE